MAYAIILCFVLMFSDFRAVTGEVTEHESCQIWDMIAQQLSVNTGAQQTCTSNGTQPCTRIDCNGAYEYNSKNMGSLFGLGNQKIEVDYCFGLILNHCHQNISLDFYMQVPAKHVDQTTRVYHNTLLTIPGLSYKVAGVSAQGFLYFKLLRQGDNVTFSVTVKVRMSLAGRNMWPPPLERTLISNETIPVPPCRPGQMKSSTAIPTIDKCKPPTWKNDQSTSDKPDIPTKMSGDLGKLCTETDFCTRDPWLACDRNTNRCVCSPDFQKVTLKTGVSACEPWIRHGKACRRDEDCSLQMSERCYQGRCECQEGDEFNQQTQTCERQGQGNPPGYIPPSVTGAPHVAPVAQPSQQDDKDKGSNKVPMIVGAVVGGLVVLAGLLVAAYFAIRRLRRPYHNRQILLDGEDSDGIM